MAVCCSLTSNTTHVVCLTKPVSQISGVAVGTAFQVRLVYTANAIFFTVGEFTYKDNPVVYNLYPTKSVIGWVGGLAFHIHIVVNIIIIINFIVNLLTARVNRHHRWLFLHFSMPLRSGRIGTALVSRAGDRAFEPMIESNQWLIKLILVAS